MFGKALSTSLVVMSHNFSVIFSKPVCLATILYNRIMFLVAWYQTALSSHYTPFPSEVDSVGWTDSKVWTLESSLVNRLRIKGIIPWQQHSSAITLCVAEHLRFYSCGRLNSKCCIGNTLASEGYSLVGSKLIAKKTTVTNQVMSETDNAPTRALVA